jgi:hypothetical protein
MNDMSGRFLAGTAVDFPIDGLNFRSSRLSPPRAFVEAATLIDNALVELRAVEHALERQLGDLSSYLKAPAPTSN